MQKYEFKTLEEYREHQRELSRNWYKRNREKKCQYQKERYYKLKAQREESLENK